MIDLAQYRDMMDRCTYCQVCQAVCPVYLEDLVETHVARARIGLIQAVLLEERMPVSRRFREILDRCLLCTRCTQTCPPGVPVDDIVVAARNRVYGGKRRGLVARQLMKMAMTQRGLKGMMNRALSMAKALGWVVDGLPEPAPEPFDEMVQGRQLPADRLRGRVAYYVGCMTHSVYTDTARASVAALLQNGFEVLLPEGLVCCGMPALVEGDLALFRESVAANAAVLAALEVDAVVTDCTSCRMVLGEKAPKAFATDDAAGAQVRSIAGNVWEITDFLVAQGLCTPSSAFAKRVTYHVPCHCAGSETLQAAPRRLVESLADATLVEMAHPDRCCGAGGFFFMEHGSLSGGIRAKKVDDIRKTQAEVVMTQCPACRTYLSAALPEMRVVHPVSLLAGE